MFEIRKTEAFDAWLTALRDKAAQALIAERVNRLAFYEHFGDAKVVAPGITELRVHHGPGYRLYATRRGKRVIILLCGGDKGSQRRDIARAVELAALISRDMAIKVSPFDAADYLTTAEACAVFLTEALKSDDVAYIANALGVVARARGMAEIARKTGLSREGLYKTLSVKGNPELSTVLKILEAVGLKLVVQPTPMSRRKAKSPTSRKKAA